MRLSLTRLDARRYATVVERRDGTRYHVTGVGHMFAIPHDLAHLAVERALGLRHGFWGCVADGAVFDSMTHVAGRRRPGAAARSRQIMKERYYELGDAEVLVRIVNDAIEAGHGPGSAELRARVRGRPWLPPDRPPRRFSDEEIAGACAAWREMLAEWTRLPVGGTMELAWPEGMARTA